VFALFSPDRLELSAIDRADVALSARAFSEFSGAEAAGLRTAVLIDHSLTVAAFGRRLAAQEGQGRDCGDDAFMAGTIHDVGQFVLADGLPEATADAVDLARREDMPLWEAELSVFGATHAEVGARLMRSWGLPDVIVEAVAYHHRPECCAEDRFSALTLLHVADVFDQERTNRGHPPPRLSTSYLRRLGLMRRVEVWRKRRLAAQDGEEEA
jgi:putative nucleotidyltransferase with HDIG domain